MVISRKPSRIRRNIARMVFCPYYTNYCDPFRYLEAASNSDLAKILHPDIIPISVQDVNFILDSVTEQDNLNKNEDERVSLSVIGCYLKVAGEGKTNMIELKQLILERLINSETKYNWKLKSYFVRFCGSYFWKKCENFNIENNVKWACLLPGTDIEAFLNTWIQKPFAARSPLWEAIVLDTGSEECIAIKLHHAFGDALSLFELVMPFALPDTRHNPRVEKIIKSSPPQISTLEKVKLFMRLPWLLLDYIFMVIGTPDPFQNQTQANDSNNLPVGFQTVLMSLYAGAIRRLLEDTGRPIPKFLVIPVAQPWPGRPEKYIGNSWSVLMVPIPINISDPLQRLEKLQSNITEFYMSGSFLMCKYLMMNLFYIFPSFFQLWFKDFVCVRYSLSPILTADEYGMYDGRKVDSLHGIIGLIFKTFKIMALTVSVNDVLTWNVTGACDVFRTQADLDVLVQEYISAEFDQLRKAIKAEEESRSLSKNG